MSTEWTAERLDALPEGTVIEEADGCLWVRRKPDPRDYAWDGVGESVMAGSADFDSIRVVSVPIDALLADETVHVAEDAFVEVTHLAGPIRNEAEQVLRAAVAHITGEATV